MFIPGDFLSIAFDSGGVTTGPMTVPFIMALGVGVSAIRSDRHAADDSFGLVSLCSVGPILAVMVLSMIFNPQDALVIETPLLEVENSRQLWALFTRGLPEYMKEICISSFRFLRFLCFSSSLCSSFPEEKCVRF